jgi:hypothetical protein
MNIRLPYKTGYFLILFENSRSSRTSTLHGVHQLQNEAESLVTAASDGTITPIPEAKLKIGVWNKR